LDRNRGSCIRGRMRSFDFCCVYVQATDPSFDTRKWILKLNMWWVWRGWFAMYAIWSHFEGCWEDKRWLCKCKTMDNPMQVNEFWNSFRRGGVMKGRKGRYGPDTLILSNWRKVRASYLIILEDCEHQDHKILPFLVRQEVFAELSMSSVFPSLLPGL